jgi:hypothetical protein
MGGDMLQTPWLRRQPRTAPHWNGETVQTRSIVAVVATAAAFSLTAGTAEPAALAAHSSKNVPPGTHLLLTFDHREPLKRGTVVRDASGHHHSGVVLTRHGGSLRAVRGWFKRAAAFPRLCDPNCGRAIVEVADRSGLDPQHHPFVFGAAVKTTPHQARIGGNIVQKGYFKQAGGQYKLQLDAGGIPSCVVFGGLGRVIVNGTRSVADGRWHRLSCTRTSVRVVLRVDSGVSGVVRGATGFIGSTAPVRVGGKKTGPGNDQFHGAVDSVFLRLLSPTRS